MRTRLLLFLLTVFSASASAQNYTYSTLARFKAGGPSNPSALIIDSTGNLYGTSYAGGTYGDGTVFKVTAKGAITTLHSFNGADGSGPSGLVRDVRQGNLYGVTAPFDGAGTVFKLAAGKGGKYTYSTLYSDSAFRPEGLTLDSTGNLYGPAFSCPDNPCVFEIPSGGEWTELYDDPDAGFDVPTSNLIVDRSGSLYSGYGYPGIAGNGWITEYPAEITIGCCASIVSSLRQDAAGNIYGTEYGNAGGGTDWGTVFKLNITTDVVSILYTFCSLPNCADGSDPANLTLDSKGNAYGTNSAGVFKLTSAGVESLIYSGTVGTGLVMDKSGNLYGTTSGSVYKLTKN